jgi:TPR repeat protein
MGKNRDMDIDVWNEAVHALDAKDYVCARALFASLGEIKEAQLQLGYLYQEGLGGEASPEKSQEIFQSLADANDIQGLYHLGRFFLKFSRLPEAAHYFEKSAQLGHVSGAYWASALHRGVYGHSTDIQKHRTFLELAVKLGHIYGKRDLALEDAQAASTLRERGTAYLRYLGILAQGIALTIRDRHDPRIC